MEHSLNMKLFLALVLLGFGSACDHWSYEEPWAWKNCFSTCGRRRQSPIDIPDAASYASNLDSLEFRNYGQTFEAEIENNGHSIEVHIPEGVDLILAEGGLSGQYRAEQFHFHWGADDEEGSEHTLNGEAFPLEMHVVHYNRKYDSVKDALSHSDGLAVVSFLFEIDSSDNDNYDDLIDAVRGLVYKGSHRTLYGVNLLKLTLQDLPDGKSSSSGAPDFFRYQGSLTTPPCSEIVTWTVMKEFVKISASQVAAFRRVSEKSSGRIYSSDRIKENFRPVQGRNGRSIYSSN